MAGFSQLQIPRSASFLVAGAFLVVAAILAVLYFWSPRAVLRITTGPANGAAQRLISAIIAVTEAEHPRIRFETVPTPDLKASSRALEERRVNIALVRSDASPPLNGQSLAILRRDVVAIVLPPASPIKNVAQLSGKTIAIPLGPAQNDNAHALDLILDYSNVPRDGVKRLFLPLSEIGAAIRDKQAAAALAVGPVGPGETVDVVAAIASAVKGAPGILPMDEAEAFGKRFPGFEPIDVPTGAFRAIPPTPKDAVKGLAVSYRLVVPATMLNAVAGAIGRSIFKTKSRMMALTPLANQIEAPDPDEKNPILPIHPGVAAYLARGDQSFLDSFQKYLYVVGIPLSVVGSAAAVVAGFLRNRRLKDDLKSVSRLLVIASETSGASRHELEALEAEFHAIVADFVNRFVEGKSEADRASVSLAIEHARRAIESRKIAFTSAASHNRTGGGAGG